MTTNILYNLGQKPMKSIVKIRSLLLQSVTFEPPGTSGMVTLQFAQAQANLVVQGLYFHNVAAFAISDIFLSEMNDILLLA